MALYGAELTALGEGYVEISLEPKDFLTRPSGAFHGGVLAALADTAGGYAAATAKKEDPYFVTVELKISYLRPAQGERLQVEGRVIKDGRSLTFCQVDIYAVTGEKKTHCAMATLTMMRLQNGAA